MTTEGNGFRYFIDGKEVEARNLAGLISIDMIVEVRGCNVYYKLPKKENKEMKRLVEEELERQGQQVFKDWDSNSTNNIKPFISMDVNHTDNLIDCKRQSKSVKCGKQNCITCNTVDFNNSDINVLQKMGILNPVTCDKYFTIDDKEEIGKKEIENKTDYSEIDWQFIEGLAKRMNKNKEKYEPFNYHKPMDIELLKQSLLRHTLEIMKGNYDDAGQELGHFYATSLNAMMIVWQIKNNKLGYIK